VVVVVVVVVKVVEGTRQAHTHKPAKKVQVRKRQHDNSSYKNNSSIPCTSTPSHAQPEKALPSGSEGAQTLEST
jgi:hypothetical protein